MNTTEVWSFYGSPKRSTVKFVALYSMVAYTFAPPTAYLSEVTLNIYHVQIQWEQG